MFSRVFQRTVSQLIAIAVDLASALLAIDPGGFHLLPANQDLTAAEVRLLQMPEGRETKLRNALAGSDFRTFWTRARGSATAYRRKPDPPESNVRRSSI